jgi:hypothetical protein
MFESDRKRLIQENLFKILLLNNENSILIIEPQIREIIVHLFPDKKNNSVLIEIVLIKKQKID